MDKNIVFLDLEVNKNSKKIDDFGAVKENKTIHTQCMSEFVNFISDCDFICGHNIISHDLKYISEALANNEYYIIDTLALSPLLFPEKPYHALVKDDKLQVDELNNPLNDSIKAKELFYDEINAFYGLGNVQQRIYRSLLEETDQFKGFFNYVDCQYSFNLEKDIRREFADKICINANIQLLIKKCPIELAYALALIHTDDKYSITPPWVYVNYPLIENVMKLLRNTPCNECSYCKKNLNIKRKLKQIFGYDDFRKYNGEPLQEMATQAAVDGKSLLAIFPTGGANR